MPLHLDQAAVNLCPTSLKIFPEECIAWTSEQNGDVNKSFCDVPRALCVFVLHTVLVFVCIP
eukprot:scaffold649371_cov52-Prasinocladus_malaysianus.AAC.1